MNQKAVIDLGSLKTKVAVFDKNNNRLLDSASYLTLMGKGIKELGIIDPTSLKKQDEALGIIAKNLSQKKIGDISIIGTEALRNAQNIQTVHALIEKHYPNHRLEVIDQDKEADLFFAAVGREFPSQKIVAMDIGGGSVQLIYGSYNPKTSQSEIYQKHKLSTGTYSLQQQYSPDNDIISAAFPDAVNYVANAYKKIKTQADILVFGSTCMQDFAQAAGLGKKVKTTGQHNILVNKNDLQKLLSDVRQLPPDQRSHHYPDGGYFMYGADYLLLNLLEAIDRIQPSQIYPTNLNSSYAFIEKA